MQRLSRSHAINVGKTAEFNASRKCSDHSPWHRRFASVSILAGLPPPYFPPLGAPRSTGIGPLAGGAVWGALVPDDGGRIEGVDFGGVDVGGPRLDAGPPGAAVPLALGRVG